MKDLLEDMKADSVMWRGSIVTMFLLIICISYLAYIYRLLPPIIPLFHQLPWGEERLADKIGIILPLGFTICAVCVNAILATMLHQIMPLVGRILIITSILLTLLLGIFLLKTSLLIL